MINPPLRKIQTLVCLAETGSFRRTAERLGISQPAVSGHIRELEAAYGVALVHRTTRRVALTPEGKAFAARAVRALAELEHASRDLHDLGTAHRGQVTVACAPPLMSLILPGVLRGLDRDYPAVEVRLLDAVASQLETLVVQREADLGIGPRPESPEVAFEALRRDDFVAIMPANHLLAARRTVALADVLDHPLIVSRRATSAGRILDRAFERLGRTVRPRFELTHYISIGRFVEAGLGVAIMPALAFAALRSDGVVALPIRSPRICRDVGLIRRKEYRPSPAATAFMTVLRLTFAEAPAAV